MLSIRNTIAIALAVAASTAVAHELFPETYASLAVKLRLPASDEVLRVNPSAYLVHQEREMEQNRRSIQHERGRLLRECLRLEASLLALQKREASIDHWLSEAKVGFQANLGAKNYVLAGQSYTANRLRIQVASLLEEKDRVLETQQRVVATTQQLDATLAKLSSAAVTYDSRLALVRSQRALLSADAIVDSLLSNAPIGVAGLIHEAKRTVEHAIRTSEELDLAGSRHNQNSIDSDRATKFLKG